MNTFYWCLFGEGLYEPTRTLVIHTYIFFLSFLVLATVYLLILGVEVSVGGILSFKIFRMPKKKEKSN